MEENNQAVSEREVAPKQKSGKFFDLFADERKFWQRLFIALFVSLAFAYTFFVFGPIELFFSNSSFIPFTFDEMLPLLLRAGGVVFGGLLVVSLVLRGRLFDCYIALLFGVLLAGYIQGNFLNLNLGALDGTAIAWQRYTTHALINTAIWGGIISLPFVVKYFSRKSFSWLVAFVSCALIIMQSVAMITFPFGEEKQIEQAITDKGEGYLSVENQFSLSPEGNVVVFLLDRCDNNFIDKVLEDKPDYFAPLTGFTRFTNATSRYYRTYPSLVYLLTGEPTDYSVPIEEYQRTAWQNTTFYNALKTAGYCTRIYGTLNYTLGNAENGIGIVDNLKFTNEETEQQRYVDTHALLKEMLGFCAYRYAPHALKPSFWLHTGDIEDVVKITTIDKNDASYTINDPQFYTDLTTKRLNATGGKSFTFYHLQGSHDPYTMNAKSEYRVSGTTIGAQTEGAFNIVLEYISQMKELGVYENSTIVIIADHGDYGSLVKLDKARTICYFVKPAGESESPFTTSKAPVSQDNFIATVLASLNIEHSAYGISAFDVSEDEKTPRYFGFSALSENRSRRDARLITYKIVGNANNFDNWIISEDIEIEYPFYDRSKK